MLIVNQNTTLMKRILHFSVIMLLSITVLTAQEEKEPRFLFQEGNVMLSGFGGPLVEFTAIGDKFAVCSGGGGGILLNQTLFIGGYGMGLSTNHFRDDLKDIVSIDRPKLYFNHGGLWIGYIHNHHNPFHCGFSLKVGGGEIAMVDEYFNYPFLDERRGVDKIFVITPQVEFEMNFTTWMKMNIGAGYRFTGGVDKSYQQTGGEVTKYYQQKDFSTPFLSLNLLFGWFDQSK